MFKDVDLTLLRRRPDVAFYFRYPLHHADFRELRDEPGGRLLGRFAAKPLYGQLTPEGRVDRSAPLNGRIAILFIPARARSSRAAHLYLTRLPRACLLRPDGRRNWPAIRHAAEHSLRRRARTGTLGARSTEGRQVGPAEG
jgi:hypothetical protein